MTGHLYLMRHGETEFNRADLVQGRCDSPLTACGIAQAHIAARWLADRGADFDQLVSSPLGRARSTAELIRDDLIERGRSVPPAVALDGLIERSYGSLEAGPRANVPADLWDPGDAVVPFGGESKRDARGRVVRALSQLMADAGSKTVLAISHGALMVQFRQAWVAYARCAQDGYIGNCCVLVFSYDAATGAFSNTSIVNHDFSELHGTCEERC
ncbi:Phosphoglycerate mutase [Coriobacterium glomerans PW2]|uniref:Phosphoglycerate mutase n=1 Tax=Coriobacterium glomerans (strain ATCC 49209 / DSM 20642 / JCM 10262 / PW2) TaxID=700015 RepID=F2N9U4_CORGP|nr:histidine phosphatase family protein [Coriobacterium glomerans]AEB06199.1 Phosphoglycerate mutase [Coriobacterium glomerans PW2]